MCKWAKPFHVQMQKILAPRIKILPVCEQQNTCRAKQRNVTWHKEANKWYIHQNLPILPKCSHRVLRWLLLSHSVRPRAVCQHNPASSFWFTIYLSHRTTQLIPLIYQQAKRQSSHTPNWSLSKQVICDAVWPTSEQIAEVFRWQVNMRTVTHTFANRRWLNVTKNSKFAARYSISYR